MNEISLRPVTPDDREFLLTVFAASRAIELSMVPWDADQKRAFCEHQLDAQTSYYQEKYPDARHDLILDGILPVGRLYVDRTPDEIAILDVAVLLEHRGRGIGTHVISSLIDEAAESTRSVAVYVESYNPSQKLFVDLGFKTGADDGVNVHLVWRPA